MGDSDLLRSVPWETRNLGLESFEVTPVLFEGRGVSALAEALNTQREIHGRLFAQVRVPKADLALIPGLEALGFHFVETILEPHTRMARSPVCQRFTEDPAAFMPSRYSLSEWSVDILDCGDPVRCDRVRAIAAESFIDDRFHLDPQCSTETANRRFVLWTDDLLSDDHVDFHVMGHGDQIEGFLARRGESLILAGFSRRYAARGVGDFLWLSVLKHLSDEGHDQAHTVISVNNTPVLNLYARLGFKFRNPAATLHLWRD